MFFMMLKKGVSLEHYKNVCHWCDPSCISEIDAGEILQLFGKMFFEFCQESGYDTILRVLGSNVLEFLQVGCLTSLNGRKLDGKTNKTMNVEYV